MSIFRFSPSDIPAAGANGGDVARAFMGSFLSVRQDLRAQTGLDYEGRRLELAEQQQQQNTEQFEYDKTLRPMREAAMEQDLERGEYDKTLRPIREAQARMGLAVTGMNLAQTSQQLELGQLDIASRMQTKQMLNSIMEENVNAARQTGTQPVGKVTSYGYQSDPYKDSASLGEGKFTRPTGAWNNALSAESLAISPDIEQAFKAQGIKEGDMVKLRLADGSEVVRRWDDRTMQDEQAVKKFGKPLRGRFDFYSAEGPDSRDGVPVVGFERAGGVTTTDVVSRPADATGTPVYVKAADSPNPATVVDSAFTPRIEQAFKRYDTLKLLAQSAQDPADRMQATMLVNQMEMNAEFQASLGERNLMLTAAANQTAINASIMGARQDELRNFQTVYPQYALVMQPGTSQITPVNKLTGKPLNPQEQASFQAAWTEHKKSFDPSAVSSPGQGLTKAYNDAWGIYNAGKALIGKTNLGDEDLRTQRAALRALATVQGYEMQYPEYFNLRMQEQIAEQEAARAAGQQPGAQQTGATEDTTGLTVDEMRRRKQAAEANQLELARLADVTASMNSLAAKIASEEGLPGLSAINIAQEVIAGKPKPTGKKTIKLRGNVGYGTTIDETISPAEFYAKQLNVPVDDVKKWAKATVESAKAGASKDRDKELMAELRNL